MQKHYYKKLFTLFTSIIIADARRSYNQLKILRFQYQTVNHPLNFFDPYTGAYTHNIERLWGSVKWKNKKHRGTAKHFLNTYFAEFFISRRQINY